MAEFCLDCLNKLDNKNLTERDVILADEDDLDWCEGCCEWKRTVVRYKLWWERLFNVDK